jgi:hypothetical protein
MAVWAVFFAYELSVASRVAKLRADLERLKKELLDG